MYTLEGSTDGHINFIRRFPVESQALRAMLGLIASDTISTKLVILDHDGNVTVERELS